jgi:hypothetical protein
VSVPQAPRAPSPPAGEGGRRDPAGGGAPTGGVFDFSDEIAGRSAERATATSDGWKLVLTISAVIVIVTGFALWQLATAGLEPAAKREDRLTPSPLPKAFCTAPAAAGEAG